SGSGSTTGGGGGGLTGAARLIAGMCDSGADSMLAKTSSDAALRLVENQTNSPPITASAPAPITQVGTAARAGLYGACTPCQCGDRAGSAAAAHCLMEGGHQRTRRPAAAAAPGRIQHDIVHTGAQGVMRRTQLLHRHAAVARRRFE